MSSTDATLLRRLLTYQAERFPLVAYVPLMAVGSFAAVAFSRAARSARAAGVAAAADMAAFPWTAWAVGVVTLVVFFFYLRVLDEHKDAVDDARYRPELPVPRGLVTLRELRGAALLALAAAIVLNALIEPALLVVMAVVLAWAGFMGREFFIRDWLRAHPAWYLVSHMVVMPLVFLYATALDWLVAGAGPPPGTAAFLGLAFSNGLVIEVGRKLRSPGEEREGVDSYTGAWGTRPATAVWLAALVAAAAFAMVILSTVAVGGLSGVVAVLALAAVALLLMGTAAPAALLLARPEMPRAGPIELASGLWVLGSYGLVGVLAWLALAGVPA